MADKPSLAQRRHEELKESIAEIHQMLAVMAANYERDRALTEKHESALFGDNETPGLMSRVGVLERQVGAFIRATWALLLPLLAAIGGGIVYLIRQVGQ